jgi:hypothetical protein
MGRQAEYSGKQLRNIALLAVAGIALSAILLASGFQWSPLPVIGCVALVVLARLADKRQPTSQRARHTLATRRPVVR